MEKGWQVQGQPWGAERAYSECAVGQPLMENSEASRKAGGSLWCPLFGLGLDPPLLHL